MTISEMCAEAHLTSTANGFTHENVPGLLALIHSEVSEALEAHRKPKSYEAAVLSERFPVDFREHRRDGNTVFYTDTVLQDNFLTQNELELLAEKKQMEHFVEELADILIRVADLAESQGLDLEAAVVKKMRKNKTRGFRHGKAY